MERRRLVSLDVFRGMTIFLMIIVNTPGSGAVPFPQLLHAEWHGFTLTDLVFPSFLFAVGNAIPFASIKWKNSSQKLRLRKIFQRSLLIFLVGYLLNWYTSMHFTEDGSLQFVPLSRLRILGVLQRIGICYLFAAILAESCDNRKLILISGVTLIGYWLLLYFGGEVGDPYSVTGNFIRKIDIAVIGERFMYKEHGVVFDPEGLISTFPATVNVLAGIICGRLTLQHRAASGTTTMLLATAVLLILAGICWSWFFPLNKKLWTSSFVLLTVGIDIAVVAMLHAFESSGRKIAGTEFFSVMGRNPLAIYVFSNLLLFVFILRIGNADLYSYVNERLVQSWLPGPVGSLFFAICIGMICWTLAWVLNKRKIYIRL